MEVVEIHCLEPIYNAASHGQFYVEVWTGEAAASHFQKQWDLQKAFAKTLVSRKVLVLSYVAMAKFKAPDGESRTILKQRTIDLQPYIQATAVMLAGKGFGSAIVRAVIASLNMLQRN